MPQALRAVTPAIAGQFIGLRELPPINRGLQASTALDTEDFLPTFGLTLPPVAGTLVPNVNNLKPSSPIWHNQKLETRLVAVQ